jgi:hypothetical protein
MTPEKVEKLTAKINSIRIKADSKLQQEQAKAAANAASLYVHVLDALRDIVPDEQLHTVAATVTAGMYSTPGK